MSEYDLEIDPLTIDKDYQQYGAVVEMPVSIQNGNKYKKERQSGNVRDSLAQAQLRAGIAALWRDGDGYKEIANQINDSYGLDLSPNTIHYHVKAMLAFWRKLSLARLDERQAMLLARLDQIEMLACEAYFQSMQGRTTQMTEKQIERARSNDTKKKLQKNIRKERDDIKKAKKSRGKEHKQAQLDIEFNEDGDMFDILVTTSERIKEYVRTEENPAGDPRFLQVMLDCNKQRAQLWGMLNRKDAESDDKNLAKLTDEDRANRLAIILHDVAVRRTKNTGSLAPTSPLGGFFDEEGKPLPVPADANKPVLEGAFFDDDDDWGDDD